MPVDDEFMRELTHVVWTTVLGLDVEETAPGPTEVEEITTSIDISGAWEGTISLSFSRLLGRRLAAAMLDCPESEATPALIQDVVGELANVIGGNVKGVLPGPCKLSLPRVDAQATPQVSPNVDRRFCFDCAGQPFSVTVLTRSPIPRSTS
jgi:chemotaxis protein CheX